MEPNFTMCFQLKQKQQYAKEPKSHFTSLFHLKLSTEHTLCPLSFCCRTKFVQSTSPSCPIRSWSSKPIWVWSRHRLLNNVADGAKLETECWVLGDFFLTTTQKKWRAPMILGQQHHFVMLTHSNTSFFTNPKTNKHTDSISSSAQCQKERKRGKMWWTYHTTSL